MKPSKCLTCGKLFTRKPDHNREPKFCSRFCFLKRRNIKHFNTKYSALSNEYLLEKLKEAAVLLGGVVYSRDIDKLDGFPKRGIYERRFGSWKAAVKIVGLPTGHRCSPNPNNRNVTLKLRFQVLKRDNFTCQYCGRTPQDGIKLVADHIIPFSKGGQTVLKNLITACFQCNSGKSNYILE